MKFWCEKTSLFRKGGGFLDVFGGVVPLGRKSLLYMEEMGPGKSIIIYRSREKEKVY